MSFLFSLLPVVAASPFAYLIAKVYYRFWGLYPEVSYDNGRVLFWRSGEPEVLAFASYGFLFCMLAAAAQFYRALFYPEPKPRY